MKKTLVAYFSASGVTKKVAQALSVAANADIYVVLCQYLGHKKSNFFMLYF